MAESKNDQREDFQRFIAKLENMILIGAFQPRERLVEIHLAKKLDVSRTWIRDALKILEAKGLVRIIPHRGAMVRGLDEREIAECFEIRIALEKLSNRLTCKNFKKADGHALKRISNQIKDSFRRHDFEEMIIANNEFHNYIRELSGNKMLTQMINQLRGRIYLFNTYAWSSPDIAKQLVEEHDLSITALEKKDVELLDDLTEKHLSHSKDLYLLQLKTRKAIANQGSDL